MGGGINRKTPHIGGSFTNHRRIPINYTSSFLLSLHYHYTIPIDLLFFHFGILRTVLDYSMNH